MEKWRKLKKWQKIVIIVTVSPLVFWGFMRVRRYRVERGFRIRAARNQQIRQLKAVAKPVSHDPDDAVVLRAEHPESLQDEKNLKGHTLWVSAGGQMEYFAFNGKSIDLNHSGGDLLGAERIVVQDAVEQVVPRSVGRRFPDAEAEVLLVFVRPDDSRNPAKQYAVAVGDREGHVYNLITDQLFFYDDPHKLYEHWGAKIWEAIDAHKAVVGMTERQLQMSLGQVSTPRGDIMGDRSIEYDNQGKPKLVTFEKGKAIQIRDESQ